MLLQLCMKVPTISAPFVNKTSTMELKYADYPADMYIITVVSRSMTSTRVQYMGAQPAQIAEALEILLRCGDIFAKLELRKPSEAEQPKTFFHHFRGPIFWIRMPHLSLFWRTSLRCIPPEAGPVVSLRPRVSAAE